MPYECISVVWHKVHTDGSIAIKGPSDGWNIYLVL